MMTALTILAAVALAVLIAVLVAGTVFMVCDAIHGNNPFAFIWLVCGGFKASAELIGTLIVALFEMVGEILKGFSE